MSALVAVLRILQADAAVSAKVGQRRFPVSLPQDADTPTLILTLVDEEDGSHLLGHDHFPVARFLVDCVAGPSPADHFVADDLGDLVKAALMDYRGSVEGFDVTRISLDGVDHFDRGATGEHWRRRIGFFMRYRVAEPADDPEDSPPA